MNNETYAVQVVALIELLCRCGIVTIDGERLVVDTATGKRVYEGETLLQRLQLAYAELG
jgi:hypothetical protein